MKLKPNHPALSEARTIHTKMVRQPNGRLLKPVKDNIKLGKGKGVITAQKWYGMPMFALTLEERATCPPDCFRWDSCFGNGMAFAHRFEHGPELIKGLDSELNVKALQFPEGFVVRTHILGDYYSVEYVRAWHNWLWTIEPLHVFGYSARLSGEIHQALRDVRDTHGDRFQVRFSTNESWAKSDPSAIYAADNELDGKAFQCPEQTGRTESCLTCGLCWMTKKTVWFQDHDALRKGKKMHNTK